MENSSFSNEERIVLFVKREGQLYQVLLSAGQEEALVKVVAGFDVKVYAESFFSFKEEVISIE